MDSANQHSGIYQQRRTQSCGAVALCVRGRGRRYWMLNCRSVTANIDLLNKHLFICMQFVRVGVGGVSAGRPVARG